MKILAAVAATCAILLGTSAHGAVLDLFPGPFTDSGSTPTVNVFNTATATGNWLDFYDEASDVGTLYFSMDVTVDNNVDETGTGGFFAGLEMIGSVAGAGLAVGNYWASTRWGGVRFGDFNLQPDDATTEIISGSSVMIAGKMVLGPLAGDDEVTLWLNPIPGAEGAQPASHTTTLTAGDAYFNAANVRSGNGVGQSTYSNIVYGTDFSDVVIPEPSTLALAALGLLGLACRGRRR